MGLGIAAIRLNLDLWQRGLFKDFKNVLDMGSQDLQLALDDFEELILAKDVNGYKRENFTALSRYPSYPRQSAKSFYQLLGLDRYSCIDSGEQHGAIQWDLNYPFEDTSLYGRFDLVTDFGTNEHVFNTGEAYRTMHRLCRTDGLMIIDQALFEGNGYFSYSPTFFEGIAKANRYEILFSSYIISSQVRTKHGSPNEHLLPISRELLDLMDRNKLSYVGLLYVMKKRFDEDFQYPHQNWGVKWPPGMPMPSD